MSWRDLYCLSFKAGSTDNIDSRTTRQEIFCKYVEPWLIAIWKFTKIQMISNINFIFWNTGFSTNKFRFNDFDISCVSRNVHFVICGSVHFRRPSNRSRSLAVNWTTPLKRSLWLKIVHLKRFYGKKCGDLLIRWMIFGMAHSWKLFWVKFQNGSLVMRLCSADDIFVGWCWYTGDSYSA